MKSIELTEEHITKLLEMCKILFPNDKVDYIQNDTIKFLIGYYERKSKVNPKITFEGWKETLHIHWFEFCMTYLIERLSDKLPGFENFPPYVSNVYSNAKGKWNLYTKFHFYYPKACTGGTKVPMNPVDYLYKEFKKLK